METYLGFGGLQIGVIMASGTVLMMVFLRPMGIMADHGSRRTLVLVGGFLAASLDLLPPFCFRFMEPLIDD